MFTSFSIRNVIVNFNLLFVNCNQIFFVVVFEVVGGLCLRTGLLIGQLTIVVRIAHFIIRFRNVFRCFTVVIL